MRFFGILYVALTQIAYLVARNVRIDVKADWPVVVSSPLVEMAEFLYDVAPENFWKFADNLCNSSISSRIDGIVKNQDAEMISEMQTIAYEAAISIMPQPMHHIMDTTVGLSAYAPSTQFYHAISEANGGSPCSESSTAYGMIYPGGQRICSLEEYKDLRTKKFIATCVSKNDLDNCLDEDSAEAQSTSWDHVYPSDFRKDEGLLGKHIVLYGTLGSTSFCELHSAAKEDAHADNTIRYSARHAFINQRHLSEQTTLPGYGMFLDIKNMEYNTVNKDDGEKSATQSAEKKDPLAGIADGVDISGIYFSRLLERRPSDREELGILKEELEKMSLEKQGKHGGEMKVWKLKDLGLQTAQAIVSSSAPADKFAEYVQSFPSFAPEISSIKLKATFVDSINVLYSSGIQQMLPPNCLMFNGVRVDLGGSTFNIFDMLSTLRKEYQQESKIASLGLSSIMQEKLIRASNAISGGAGGSAAGGSDPSEGIIRIDVSKGGKYVVAFLNNLEKDAMYKRWPMSMRQMLMPSWSLHSIARNLYTTIFTIDPFSFIGISLVMQIQNLMAQQYPLRFGIVLQCLGRTDVCQLFGKAKETHSMDIAFSFLVALGSHVSELMQSASDDTDFSTMPFPEVSPEQIQSIYASTLKALKVLSSWSSATHSAEAKETIQKREFMDYVKNCTLYIADRGLKANSFSLNGIVQAGEDISNLMQLLGREQYIITSYYRKKQITDKTKSIFNVILNLGRTYPRYHSLLEESVIEYSDSLASNTKLTQLLQSGAFLRSSACEATAPLNTTIIIFPISTRGIQSAASALRWLLADKGPVCTKRLSIAFYPTSETTACIASASSCTNKDVLEVIKVVSLVSSMQSIFSLNSELVDMVFAALECPEKTGSGWTALGALDAALAAGSTIDESSKGSLIASISEFKVPGSTLSIHVLNAQSFANLAMNALGFIPTSGISEEIFISYNSRKLTIDVSSIASQPLHMLDLALLADQEYTRAGKHIAPLVKSVEGVEASSDLLLQLCSFAGQYSSGTKRFDVHSILDEAGFTSSSDDGSVPAASAPFIFRAPASLPVSASDSASSLSVYCVVDPLSIAGQRAASLIKLFSNHLQIAVTVILLPKTEYTEFPLQNFYRQALVPHDVSSRAAVFNNLPHQHTLTVRPDAPEPWNIQAAVAEEDTDNLRCSSEGCRVSSTSVTYKLKNVLLAGQCFQVSQGAQSQQPTPPKGLQLTLSAMDVSTGYSAAIPAADTLVMQNLGYFQLLANPGLWRLDVAGSAFSIIDSSTADAGIIRQSTRYVAVRSFTDLAARVLVAKASNTSDLSVTDSSSKSMWGSLFGGATKSSKNKQQQISTSSNDTIHVFSLATGHMYERLLRIMMLSVVKRTSVKVKFWLFENYLSPTFKNVAAAMADEYYFEVAYVTYKWPDWLTQQTVKQRIIWGYKILFLDVLFPLDVKKIIYVDADQVVRADLKELWDLDLHGKPYGYTPFCTSREETLGFQFWRSGYWHDHLRGKPYHISALYVVDLHRFR